MMVLYKVKELVRNLDMKKFRKQLQESIGGDDGLSESHLELSDDELITEYLRVYGDISELVVFLSEDGELYYLKRYNTMNKEKSSTVRTVNIKRVIKMMFSIHVKNRLS